MSPWVESLTSAANSSSKKVCSRPIADIRVEQVEQSKAGRTTYSGLEVMKETQGKANPKQVNELLQKKLG